ncbi:hypothetical protein CFC21_071757 [Triticum aestivum]|uniref:C2H2-type domain-containing protein n=2 Tax=Triticum aestivum TaxID=4565 RepID=A0A3B6LMV0_WHEAT|nr:uncharacterized protein LOC123116223 [Triticum aestivum]KAF7065677.1 hypothetical protein CFC21_071757 [Triticum aestivum]
MEFAYRGRATAAADGVGVGDGRRLPDPPPPHGNDADSPQADMVALVFRREQLLHELHKERIRHDMILCELAQTERAMTACLAGLGALHGLPLMTPREEVMYRTPRSSEEASWWYRSPSGQVIPPVYPHVERSPSPVPQRRPVDDAEQQERGSSSTPVVATPSAFPEVELFRSLSKDPAVEEALVPAATNVVAKPAEPALLRKEVAIESRAAVDHEHVAGLKHRHAVQLMENGIQISGQLKRAAIGQESKAGSKDSHAVQPMESGIQISQQLNHVAIGQGSKAEAKDSHPVQLMESGIQINEPLKRASIGQGSKAEVKDNHAVQLMGSGIERSKRLKRTAVGRETKAEVKDNHALQLMESELQRTEQPNLAAVGKEQEAGLKDGHAVQLLASGIQISEQLNCAAVGQERIAEAKDSHAVQLTENKIQRSEQPKREIFGQEREAVAKDGHAVKLTENRIQRSEQPKVFGQQCEAEEKHRHAVNLMEESGIQGSEQPTPAKPPMKDCIDERRQLPHQYALAGKEKSPFNEQKRPALNEPNMQTTPSGVKRRPVFGPVVTTPSPKRQKPLEEWNCTLCQVNLTREEDLMQHKAGELHRLNLAALRSRQKAFGFDLRNHLKGSSHQESAQALHTEAGSHHLKGRSHQESAQTRKAGGGNEEGKHRRGTEAPRKEFVSKFPFCKLCKVQYSSEKVKESHLAGKKHRENLQARH